MMRQLFIPMFEIERAGFLLRAIETNIAAIHAVKSIRNIYIYFLHPQFKP
jgi:hypothetical protein